MRALVLAYTCDPGRGSEAAAGWALTRALATFANTTVLVGPRSWEGIRRWREKHPDDEVRYQAVDRPSWCSVADRFRIGSFLSYLAWLRRAYRVGKELHAQRPFEVAHHATISAYWLPTPVGRFGVPHVWGPVGGAVTTPCRLWPLLGWRGIPTELLDMVAVRLAEWWPATRRAWHEADVRLVQNLETLRRLPRSCRRDVTVLNQVQFLQVEAAPRRPEPHHLIYVSPLESRKGTRLALHALARTEPPIRLTVVGDGPERSRLERLSSKLGIVERVQFLGRVPREQVFQLLGRATGAVFSGLREEGGVSLAEALACGVPVAVLAHGGAKVVAESATDSTYVRLVRPGARADTIQRLADAMNSLCADVSQPTGSLLDHEAAVRQLRGAFRLAIRKRAATAR